MAPSVPPVTPTQAKGTSTPVSVPPVTPTQAKGTSTPTVSVLPVAPMQDDDPAWVMIDKDDADDASRSYFSPKFKAAWALALPDMVSQMHIILIRDTAYESKDKTLKLLIERNVSFSAMQAAARVANARVLVF